MRWSMLLAGLLAVGCGDDEARVIYVTSDCPGAGASHGEGGAQTATSTGVGGSQAQGGAAGAGGEAMVGGGGAGGSGEAGGGGTGDGGSGGAPLDPGPAIIISGLDRPGWLRCEGGFIYWASYATGDVQRANLDGSGVITIAPGAAPSANAVDLDGASLVYGIGGAGGRVVRVPLDGGPPTTLLDTPDLRSMTVHDGAVYWIDRINIYRNSDVFYAAFTNPQDIAADASGVYYADERGVYVLSTLGGLPRRIAETRYSGRTMILVEEHIMWSDSSAIWRAPKGLGFPETIAPLSGHHMTAAPGLIAWIGASAVYAKREGADHRAVSPVRGGDGITLCEGYMFWASSLEGIIARAVP